MSELEKNLETFDDILLEKLYDVSRILFNIISCMNMTDALFEQQLKLFEVIKELASLRKDRKEWAKLKASI